MSFGRLREKLHNVSIRVKGKIYLAFILSTLLYGVEIWMVYTRHVKKLHAFLVRHNRSIMKIKWQDKMTNIKVFNREGIPIMEHLLIRRNIHFLLHYVIMDNTYYVSNSTSYVSEET